MTTSPHAENHWNIRFGQIFRQRLSEVESYASDHTPMRLQDCFYFHPEEENIIYLEKFRKNPYFPLDLVDNTAVYRKFFAPQVSPGVSQLNKQLAEQMDATFVLIPSYGHEAIPKSQAMLDGSKGLIDLGFDFRYAPYEESWSSSRTCAKRLAEVIDSWEGLKSNIYLLAYSYGVLVALDLLEDKSFRSLRERVRGLVSLCGAVNGPTRLNDPDTLSAKKIIHLFEKVKRNTLPNPVTKTGDEEDNPEQDRKGMILEAALVKSLKEHWTLDLPWSEGIWKIVELIATNADHLIEFPEGFESLGVANAKWPEPEAYPDDCELFSISAVCPQEYLLKNSELAVTGRGSLRTHLDELYLYLVSQNLYKNISPYNDTQMLYRDTRFPPNPNRKRHHLATLKSHHWGVAFPRVLSNRFQTAFPRQALMETIVLLLAEYYGITH